MDKYALFAGLCGASAGIFGKLAGNSEFEFKFVISLSCLFAMIAMNIFMWTFFSKSLALSNSSVGPTVTSSAINFLLSGVMGALIFNEKPSFLWYISIVFVLIGLLFIVKGNNSNVNEKKKE